MNNEGSKCWTEYYPVIGIYMQIPLPQKFVLKLQGLNALILFVCFLGDEITERDSIKRLSDKLISSAIHPWKK